MSDLRVLVIADDPLARAGLAGQLAGQPGIVAAGRAASTDDLGAVLELYRPDVALWDMGWTAGDAAIRLARFTGDAALPVVALVGGAPEGRAAWAAGAAGLLHREAGSERIAAALAAAAEGLAVLDRDLAALAGEPAAAASEPAPIEALTPREIDVLRLMAAGLPNKEIARRLAISEHTVKFHVNAILGKLAVSSRTEAVVRATRLGLISL